MALTPYMNLTLPTVSVTPGPEYATENNTAFSTVDSHNHTSGRGALVPTLGININADLSFGSFNAILLRSTRYNNQVSPLALASDLNCVFFSGGELYANDASGNHVKITDGGSVNVSGSGNITGMGATTASVVYTSGNQTFSFYSNTNVKAFLATSSISIATTVASADSVTLASGTLSGGAYTLTLPTALPVANGGIIQVGVAGAMSYLNIGFADEVLNVDPTGIFIRYTKVGTNNISALAITAAKIASGTITGTQVTSNINLAGDAVKAGSRDIVTSIVNPTTKSLGIIRARISGVTIISGEGIASLVNPSTGVTNIIYDYTFADIPTVTVTCQLNGGASQGICGQVTSESVTGCTVNTGSSAGVTQNDFSILVVGQKL